VDILPPYLVSMSTVAVACLSGSVEPQLDKLVHYLRACPGLSSSACTTLAQCKPIGTMDEDSVVAAQYRAVLMEELDTSCAVVKCAAFRRCEGHSQVGEGAQAQAQEQGSAEVAVAQSTTPPGPSGPRPSPSSSCRKRRHQLSHLQTPTRCRKPVALPLLCY
jgi:hypothetical protein